ncbi:hypothetical protein D9M71_570060 [compost metagenome]
MQAADVVFPQRAAQYAFLQRFDLAMNGLADRLVVLGDEVEQGVQHEVFAMFQQQGPSLAALADHGVGFGVAVAAGDDVAVAREDMGLDEFQFAFVAHWRISDDEQRVTEGFQLGPAVFFQGIFDGQFVQVELRLQVGQLFGIGLFQADPHKMPRLARPLAAFVDADVGDLSAGAVHRRCHDSTHGCSLIPVGHGLQLGL